jgi:hypothetical protein
VLDVHLLARRKLNVGPRFCLDPDLSVIERKDPLAVGCLPQCRDLSGQHFILRLLHGRRVALALDVGSHAEPIGLDLRKRADDGVKTGQPLRRVALFCAAAQGIVQVLGPGECRQAGRHEQQHQAPIGAAAHRDPSTGASTP